MRPPVYPAETHGASVEARANHDPGFNEAAGFTQRKPPALPPVDTGSMDASMRPPVLPSGNAGPGGISIAMAFSASMRPPVLPSGNPAAARTFRVALDELQ